MILFFAAEVKICIQSQRNINISQGFIKRYQPSDENGPIEKEVMCLLAESDYPDNARELMTVIQTAVNLAQGGSITTACLPVQMRQSKQLNTCQSETTGNTITTLAEVERRHILQIYDKTGGNPRPRDCWTSVLTPFVED